MGADFETEEWFATSQGLSAPASEETDSIDLDATLPYIEGDAMYSNSMQSYS
jgi:hypothetical protein